MFTKCYTFFNNSIICKKINEKIFYFPAIIERLIIVLNDNDAYQGLITHLNFNNISFDCAISKIEKKKMLLMLPVSIDSTSFTFKFGNTFCPFQWIAFERALRKEVLKEKKKTVKHCKKCNKIHKRIFTNIVFFFIKLI